MVGPHLAGDADIVVQIVQRGERDLFRELIVAQVTSTEGNQLFQVLSDARIADAKAGKCKVLRERPQDDNPRPCGQQCPQVIDVVAVETGVRFIEDDDRVLCSAQ